MLKNATIKRKKNKLEIVRELVSKCLAIKNLIERNKDTFTLESSNGQHQQLNLTENKSEDLKKDKKVVEEKSSKKRGRKSKSKGKQTSKENEENVNSKQSARTQSKGNILTRIKEEEIVRFPFIALVSSARENAV